MKAVIVTCCMIVVGLGNAESHNITIFAESSGCGCVADCTDTPDGNYQSCSTCDVYIKCENGTMEVLDCPDGKKWDNDAKDCVDNSTTCYGLRNPRNCQQYTHDGRTHCHLPFIYKGVTYHRCTNVDRNFLWCSRTDNYDRDGKWARCGWARCNDCRVYTVHSRYCTFPFYFKGVKYDSCTDVENNGNLWCSYHTEFRNQWGKCAKTMCGDCYTPTTKNNRTCQFPFRFDGRTFEACTGHKNRGIPWCSLNGRVGTRYVDWDNCRAPVCSASIDLPVANLTIVPPNEEEAKCTGYSEHGAKCAHRFVYKGEVYTKKTNVDNKLFWCSLTTNFDVDGKWHRYYGELCEGCTVKTTSGRPCHFPFFYKGVLYNYCTRRGHTRLWCSYTGPFRDQWGNCTPEQICPSDNSTTLLE